MEGGRGSQYLHTSEIVADFQPVESTMNSDTAATIIQAYVRRYLAKRIYFQKLLEKFKKVRARDLAVEMITCTTDLSEIRYILDSRLGSFHHLCFPHIQDEAVRHEKEQQQMSEGETLVIRCGM